MRTLKKNLQRTLDSEKKIANAKAKIPYEKHFLKNHGKTIKIPRPETTCPLSRGIFACKTELVQNLKNFFFSESGRNDCCV